MSGNKLLVCPYDEAHKVKSTRMQLHITRCRMNHLNEIKFTCPFNATHVMPYQERDYHLLHCADKAPLDRMLAESLDKNNPFKGRTAVPNYSEDIPTKSDEAWDAEEEHDQTPGYLPTKERPSGAIVQPAPFLGASVKRQLYQELHHQSENIDFKPNFITSSAIPAPIPRQPKRPSEASKFELGKEDFPCLGLGRGKTLGPRIAANFYPLSATNKSTTTVRSYSSVLGTKNHNVPDEFPALGFGRGRISNFS